MQHESSGKNNTSMDTAQLNFKKHTSILTNFNHFSLRYLNGIKIETALKCIFEATMPKFSVNFGNNISQDSHKNRYPGTVCNFSFTASQYSEKC